ncbi:MAG: hypothetical protein ACYTHJ_10695 [Planctomycetota bacterium]
MVTATNDNMKKTIDTMESGFEAGINAGRHAQKAWFDAFTGMCKVPVGFDKVFVGGDHFTKDVVPMMAKHADAAVDCFDSACKTNFKAMRTLSDRALDSQDNTDIYGTARTFFDTTMETARVNFEQFTNVGKAAWTDFAGFWSTVPQVEQSKAQSKPGK